ncbi:MAG: hypothetical protein HKN68_18495 [Saprospiraceae bacterium]|nr:hypothetical protein [Saprospiraceae bacterium]
MIEVSRRDDITWSDGNSCFCDVIYPFEWESKFLEPFTRNEKRLLRDKIYDNGDVISCKCIRL